MSSFVFVNAVFPIKQLIRITVIAILTVSFWHLLVRLFDIPPFILPAPIQVFTTMWAAKSLLFSHLLVTLSEIILGLILGVACGLILALNMLLFQSIRYWLLPILLFSQAMPVFAIAPILVLWLGYGVLSKVAMSALIIFFPVLMTSFDGLRYTPAGYIDLAKTMNAKVWQIVLRIRLPAALPAFASGLRMAVVIAPIGAVIGEWVGASEGLGYYMLHSNARMQVAEMFAALFVLAMCSVSLYYLTDFLLKRAIHWSPETAK